MGQCCKPRRFVLDFLQSVRTAAKIENVLFSLNVGGYYRLSLLIPLSALKKKGCGGVLSLYSSTRYFLGFSGSGDLKPKRASLLFHWFVTLTF